MSVGDPRVAFLGDAASGPEAPQLELACRFYGFQLIAASGIGESGVDCSSGPVPILLVVHASELAKCPLPRWRALQESADRQRIPIAVLGITTDFDDRMLAGSAGSSTGRTTTAGASCGLWIPVTNPAHAGFELRGVRLELGPGPTYCLEYSEGPPPRVLATVGESEAESQPSMIRIDGGGVVRYLLARTTAAGAECSARWEYQGSHFGEIAPVLLLLREVGEARCWHPPAAVANLTIDDPWLREPYGCLSFPGLLAQMRQERFCATIGFVPWNYDRSSPDVVALFRENPEHFSIAVHGNNHDRYEFFRYETQVGDNQRAKSLSVQTFNIRQSVARMETFRERTGLEVDQVMVFPHGICPAPTFRLLKQNGFWATSNYSNVPLGERPPSDPAVALRSVNVEWEGFPALRRNYPQNLSEQAIAIDLFLGNPVLFMAHQDLFFDGINAFTPYARRVNLRQPNVQWMSLGEISRHLHLLRWVDEGRCDVRLYSCRAKIENPRAVPSDFRIAKREPALEPVERITVDGVDVPWTFEAGEVRFAASLPGRATRSVEVHYHSLQNTTSVEVRRNGFRNRCLRLIADIRDLSLSRSVFGRLLTRRYYRQGKRRPTMSSLISRVVMLLRSDRPVASRSDQK